MAASSTYTPPQTGPQSAYPTASYTPAAEGGFENAEAAPPSSYIAPATYAAPMYVSDSDPYVGRSYAAPYGPVSTSYTPAPSVSYVAPPSMYAGTASYTPAVVETMQIPGSPLPTSTTTTYVSSPSRQFGNAMGMSPAPQMMQTGSYVAMPGAPPPKLTEGMPDPSSVESQKQAYSKKIEASLRHETSMLAQRNQAQKQSLAQMVQSQKAQYNLQMDQYLQQQAMAVDQQANAEMMMLQEAATAQKMALEQQAAGLTLEYQQRKAQEEMMAREYQIQKQYYDAEQKLAQQYQKQHGINQQQLQGMQQQQQWGGSFPAPTVNMYSPNLPSMAAPMTTTTTTFMPPGVTPQTQYGMAGLPI